MKRFFSPFTLLFISFLIFSCSPEEPKNPEHLMQGVWKPLAIQYLDSSGKVVGMEKAEENPCLDKSRWFFAEQLFSFHTFLKTSTGRCSPDEERTEGMWGNRGDSYIFFYMGRNTIAETVDIIHVSRDRLILKLHGTSIYDNPEIMVFQKVVEEFDPIIILF